MHLFYDLCSSLLHCTSPAPPAAPVVLLSQVSTLSFLYWYINEASKKNNA